MGITGLNLLSVKRVGEAEDWIVLINLLILMIFIGAGIWGIDSTRLAPSAWAPTMHLAAGGMIIFVAYEGFELIALAFSIEMVFRLATCRKSKNFFSQG